MILKKQKTLLCIIAGLFSLTMLPAHADADVLHVDDNDSVKIVKTDDVPYKTRVEIDKNLPNGVEITLKKGKKGKHVYYQRIEKTKDSNNNTIDTPVNYDEIVDLPEEKVILKGANKDIIDGVSEKTRNMEKQKADYEKAEAEKQLQEAEKQKELHNSLKKDSVEDDSAVDETTKDSSSDDDSSSGLSLLNDTAKDNDPVIGVTSVAVNKAYAHSVLSDKDYECFDYIVSRESGWSTTAENSSSGAYGVGQSLPGDKMATEGSDWKTNGKTQIRWSIKYMQERYGGVCHAQDFWSHHHYY